MSREPTLRTAFDSTDVEAFAPDAKVGLLATISPEGMPHVSLITTLTAEGPATLWWGQFTEGACKANVRREPRVGFLVMTLDRRVWTGRARWLDSQTTGAALDGFNARPMFRYNAYFGVHSSHRMELVAVEGPAPLSVPSMAVGAVGATVASPMAVERGAPEALRPWARGLLRGLQTLKFLAWIDGDGFPRIVPGVGASPAGASRVVVAATGQRDALLKLAPGRTVALFAMNLQMESVLLRGTLGAFRGPPGLELAGLDITQVYNSMPPQQGLVWPQEPLEPVREFGI